MCVDPEKAEVEKMIKEGSGITGTAARRSGQPRRSAGKRTSKSAIWGAVLMETTIVSILFGSFLGLLFMGAPITVALGVSAMIDLFLSGREPHQVRADRLHLGWLLSR